MGCFDSVANTASTIKKKEIKSIAFLNTFFFLLYLAIALLNIDKSGNEISLYAPLISFGLFSVVKEIRMSGSKKIFKWFRQMSSYIYFIHGIVICLVAKILIMPSIENWFSVVIITFIISSLIVYIKSKGVLNWI